MSNNWNGLGLIIHHRVTESTEICPKGERIIMVEKTSFLNLVFAHSFLGVLCVTL